MKAFIKYLWKVLERTFSGMFLIVDFLGLVLLALSLKQPKIPIAFSLVVFAIIFIISTFLVWQDEVKAKNDLRIKIAELKDAIPKYQITPGALEKISIAKLIAKAITELDQVQKKIKQQASISSGGLAPTYLTSALSAFRQVSALIPQLNGGETLEEQEERLAKHLKKLEAYDSKLKRTYKVPLFFEATRSDSNVELKVQVSPECTLIVDDNNLEKHIPKTHKPQPLGSYGLASLNQIPFTSQANKLYPYSYAENDTAYSKLTKINASRKYNLFDEDFYIETSSELVELTVTVHSEKINQPQIISVKLDLKNIVPYEVDQEKTSRQ